MASAAAYAPVGADASPPGSPSPGLTLNGSPSHSGYSSVHTSRTREWEQHATAGSVAEDEEEIARVDHSSLRTVSPSGGQRLAAAACEAVAAQQMQQQQMQQQMHAAYPSLDDQHSHRLVHPSVHGDSDGDATGDLHAVGDDHAEEKSSINSSVFVLAATTLGAGILALPYAMSLLGWLFGSLLLLSVGGCSSYSIYLLLETARAVGATTYEELGHAVFPRFGRRLVVACTLVLIFGSLTAFFVIIGDTITPAIQNIFNSHSSFFTNHHTLLVTVAVVIVYPLCLLKSIHALERWSFLAVGIILLFSLLVIVESVRAMVRGTAAPNADGLDPSLSRHVHLASAGTNMFEALPIICLAFTCQTMVFPIWNSLAGGSGQARPTTAATGLAPVASMWTVVNRALVLCGMLYLPVGVFGFILFGGSTKGDVLNNFSDHVFFDVVRLAFTLAICIHYPVVHFGFRCAILQTWFERYTERENRWRFHVITVAAVVASLLLAIALPNLSTVFSLTGALCAFPYCFMFPTLFYLRLHQVGAPILHLRGPLALAAAAAAATGGAGEGAIQNGLEAVYECDDRAAGEPQHEHEHGYSPLSGELAHPAADSGKQRNGGSSPLGSTATHGGYASVATVIPVSSDAHADALFDSQLLQQQQSRCSLPPSTLPRRSLLPAYTLLGVATMLWLISIVICFKDMIHTFTTDGVK